MGKYSRLGKNTAFVFVGNISSKLISLILLPFYTRWLSVSEYGLTDILNVYVSLIIGIVSCCIGEALFIFPKDADDKRKKQYFSTGVLFLCGMMLITAIVFGIFEFIGSKRIIHNSFVENIWIVYGMTTCMLLQQTVQQFTRSLDKMLVYSITGIVVTAATALFSFIFIPRYGVYGYVAAINLAYFCGAVYSFIFSGAYRYLCFYCFSKEKCHEMLKYSIPLIPNGIMWWLVGAFNRPVMETSVGLEGIGLFAVANKFPGILTMVFSVFCVSWQISVLEEYGKEGFQAFYNRVFRIIFFCLFLLFTIVVVCCRELVMLLTTQDYYDAWKYIPLLLLGAILSAMSGLGGTVFSAVRQSKYFFYSSIWGAVTAIVANVILIPHYGVWGAALSVVLSFLAMAVCRIVYAWKYVKVEQLKKYILMLVGATISVCSVFSKNITVFYTVNVILVVLLVCINWDLRLYLITLKQKINEKSN